jgi:tetratricopeptide (TPR) repeat protein
MTSQLNDANEDELKAAANVAAGSRERLLDLAEAHQAAGRWADAFSTYQQALELQPEDADSYFELGSLYQEVDEPVMAEQSYLRALEVQPGHVESLLELGYFYGDQRRWLEALQALQWSARLTNLGDHTHAEAMRGIREILKEHGPALASSGRVRQIETKGLLDAETMATRLQSEGIMAWARQEAVGQVHGMIAGSLGAGHLVVMEGDVERARSLLDAAMSSEEEVGVPEAIGPVALSWRARAILIILAAVAIGSIILSLALLFT